MKNFVFTVDDNIWVLQELTNAPQTSLFDHPYMAMWKKLHEKYNLRVQLNLFEENDEFNIGNMTDKYRDEFIKNSDWLKLSFHSRVENPAPPYTNNDYDEIKRDCLAVHREIIRFAGREALGDTTTIHYCRPGFGAVTALKECGIKGLLGLYGSDEKPRVSYCLEEKYGAELRRGNSVCVDGMNHFAINVVLNNHSVDENVSLLAPLVGRENIFIMIHEQYFYPHYSNYQSDFAEKVEKAVAFLCENGYTSAHAQQLLY